MFAITLNQFKLWCQNAVSNKSNGIFEVNKEMNEDIYWMLALMNNTMAGEYEKEEMG